MRSEFRIFNSHAHISAVTNEEVIALEESVHKKLKRDYQEAECRVKLVGLAVFTCEVNKVAGL